jgi:hypothetical protein
MGKRYRRARRNPRAPVCEHGRVRFLRRALLALGVTGLIAAGLRVRGTGGVPPQTGGWRELSGPDLR